MRRKLSPNEGYVIKRLDEGASGVTIAAEMGISPNTVYTYRKRARKKLGDGPEPTDGDVYSAEY